jgi:hypothetical protein
MAAATFTPWMKRNGGFLVKRYNGLPTPLCDQPLYSEYSVDLDRAARLPSRVTLGNASRTS